MMKQRSLWRGMGKGFLLVLPIVLAVVMTGKMVRSAKGPERVEGQEQSRNVRVISAQVLPVVPRILGYGYVEPAQAWQGVAEVNGKVIEVHPRLQQGSFLKKGEVLLRIDPSKYDLAIARNEANIQQIKAQLAELEISEKNTQASLDIEQKTLELARNELDRQQQLLQNKTIARSVYDKQQQAYYAQLGNVQRLQNSLNLLPANRKALNANVTLNQVALKDARLDRENTVITVPFDCRLTKVNVEISQFVQRGQIVATADGLHGAEIRAQIPVGKMRPFVGSSHQTLDMTQFNFDEVKEQLAVTARVRFRIGNDFYAEWDARLTGVDASLDPQSRTLGLIVTVDEPYREVQFGVRPPLVRNMFCEVEFNGKPRPESVVIPRSAVHDGQVYLVDAENRLVVKPVEIAFSQTNFYAVRAGIEPGDTVVVSDLIPAIEGMLLEPEADQALQALLLNEATGRSEVK